MGLAASQARLLSLTSRIHDVEFEAQQLHNAKLQLALQEDKVYEEYNNALDAQALTFKTTGGEIIEATFDNLCGINSINNKMNTMGKNEMYVFRDRDGDLIVPTNIYEGFLEYNPSDPYEFAMRMVMGNDYDPEVNNAKTYGSALQDYFNECGQEGGNLTNEYTEMKGLLNELQGYAKSNLTSDEYLEDMIEQILTTDFEDSDGDREFNTDKMSSEAKGKLKRLIQLAKTCKHQMLRKKDGASEIYSRLTGNEAENFDKKAFDYYLLWGKLIFAEGGVKAGGGVLYGCKTDTSIERDKELLNESLMSGYLMIEVASLSSSGELSDEVTSTSTDSNVSFVNKSYVDSVAVKKAEAKLNKKLKDIHKIDERYDMNLNRLETERTALTTEYDSVKKVISDNIERNFGIFS